MTPAALHIDLHTLKARVRIGAVWIPAERLLNDPEQSEELKSQVRDGLRQCGLLDSVEVTLCSHK
ncbi:MAG: hypothetical protein UMU75_08575 [Halomonas sp.]|nr:hypothetical protein [Halomonas sp.]